MYKTRFMIVDLNVNGECRREIIYVGGVMMYLKTTEIYIVLLPPYGNVWICLCTLPNVV
jgi:hypothetical protein